MKELHKHFNILLEPSMAVDGYIRQCCLPCEWDNKYTCQGFLVFTFSGRMMYISVHLKMYYM